MTEYTHSGQPATSHGRAVLSRAAATTVAALVVATAGVVVQIVAGVDFPTVPPVLFILLIPAALVYFGRWRWAAIPAVLAGLFTARRPATHDASTNPATRTGPSSVACWLPPPAW